MKHYNLKIKGKVQGVWYRGSTKRKALELGIKGFVRNESDGSVYAEIEGEETQLNALIQWCKSGPPLANVTSVEVEASEIMNFKDFEIQR